jgi:hypothetical protein
VRFRHPPFLAEGREPSGLFTSLGLEHGTSESQQSQPGGSRRSATITTPRVTQTIGHDCLCGRCPQEAAVISCERSLRVLLCLQHPPFLAEGREPSGLLYVTRTGTWHFRIATIATGRLAPLRYDHNTTGDTDNRSRLSVWATPTRSCSDLVRTIFKSPLVPAAPTVLSGRARALRSLYVTRTGTWHFRITTTATGRLAPLRYDYNTTGDTDNRSRLSVWASPTRSCSDLVRTILKSPLEPAAPTQSGGLCGASCASR